MMLNKILLIIGGYLLIKRDSVIDANEKVLVTIYNGDNLTSPPKTISLFKNQILNISEINDPTYFSLYGYILEGLYYDKNYQNRWNNNTKIINDTKLFARYIKITTPDINSSLFNQIKIHYTHWQVWDCNIYWASRIFMKLEFEGEGSITVDEINVHPYIHGYYCAKSYGIKRPIILQKNVPVVVELNVVNNKGIYENNSYYDLYTLFDTKNIRDFVRSVLGFKGVVIKPSNPKYDYYAIGCDSKFVIDKKENNKKLTENVGIIFGKQSV